MIQNNSPSYLDSCQTPEEYSYTLPRIGGISLAAGRGCYLSDLLNETWNVSYQERDGWLVMKIQTRGSVMFS